MTQAFFLDGAGSRPLGSFLKLAGGEALAVVGCGGKTTLIESLARENPRKKVLIMPTTKIHLPPKGSIVASSLAACLAHKPAAGVQYLGIKDEARGKLCAPPKEHWQTLAQGYDLVLTEADGSRGLPCKGWLETEPQIPAFTTHTIGVMVLGAAGLLANEQNVLHLPQFCALTGLKENEAITLEALADMVCGKGGMFKNTAGEKILCINRAESEEELGRARQFAKALRNRHSDKAPRIFAGSCAQNLWLEI